MKVLLLDNVLKLGKMGDVIDVSDGYARNYLLLRRLAVVATDSQVKKQSEMLAKRKANLDLEKEKYQQLMTSLSGTVVKIKRKATDDGKLFGKVGVADIKKELANMGFDISEVEVDTSNVMKNIGEYEIDLIYDNDIKTKIKIIIEKED